MSDRPKLSHRLEYAAYQAVAQTVGNLPLPMATGFSAGVARLAGVHTGLRKRAERNLMLAMPHLSDAERRGITVEMFDSLARTATEYRYLKRLLREADRIELSGIEHLKAAQSAGRGAVLATGHFGNWEAIRLAFAQAGWPPALIYRRFNNPYFDAHAQRLMQAIDAPLFHKGRRGSLGMVRHVKGGGCALILTDQRFGGAPELPFFERPAKTSLGAAEIALNFGAALLPVRGERIGRDSRFRVVIEPPVPVEGRPAEAIMADMNLRLQSWIEASPGQYFWMHNRWGKQARDTDSQQTAKR